VIEANQTAQELFRARTPLLGARSLVAGEAFSPGQTWTYRTKPNQTSSRVVILRVEDHPKAGRLVHVSLVGLGLWRKPGASPEGWNIAHLAFAESALRNSVIQLDQTVRTAPDAADKTYRQWKRDADRGRVQAWTVSVAEAMEEIERRVLAGNTSPRR
jgi:hypothetical protein